MTEHHSNMFANKPFYLWKVSENLHDFFNLIRIPLLNKLSITYLQQKISNYSNRCIVIITFIFGQTLLINTSKSETKNIKKKIHFLSRYSTFTGKCKMCSCSLKYQLVYRSIFVYKFQLKYTLLKKHLCGKRL